MENEGRERRIFLKGVVAGGTVAVGYTYLTPDEGSFIESVVDHMIPADQYTPKGTDLGVHIYIDRALSSGWGKGARLYRQGPWKLGSANQGHKLPLTPAELYRNAIAACNEHCVKQYGKPFDRMTAEQREAFLLGLQSGKVTLKYGPPARNLFIMGASTFAHNGADQPTGLVGALAYCTADMIKNRYVKTPARWCRPDLPHTSQDDDPRQKDFPLVPFDVARQIQNSRSG